MIDQGLYRQVGGPSVAWPHDVGTMPAMGTFSPRPETGHGLDTYLTQVTRARQDGAAFRATVLVGSGGYGKTHLASAALASLAGAGAVDLRVWITASSVSRVLLGYARAAAEIGLAERGASPEEAAARLLGWLRQTDRNWVVVLDDVTDPALLRDWLPDGGNGDLLVTCRPSADLAEFTGLRPRICTVGEFSPREALNYLTSRLYDDTDQRVQAVDLAADLAYMPLALSLATSAMGGTGMSCREYRMRFANRRGELAGRSADGAVSAADAAWALALDRADQRPPAGLARTLIALISLLDPAGIPLQLLTSRTCLRYLSDRMKGSPVDPPAVWAALANLAQSGLVVVGQSPGHSTVTIHPVIQEIARRLIPAAVLSEATRAVADVMSDIWPDPGTEPALAEALRECVACLAATAGAILWGSQPHPVLIRAGQSYDEDGLAEAAVGYWKAMLARSARLLGAQHVQTLVIRDWLADACERSGTLDEAIELALVSVAEREQTYGANHPETTGARIRLADKYRAATLYDVAIDVYRRALADREWELGSDHQDTLAVRSQLAITFRLSGEHDQAIVMHQRNLAEWERVAGSDHRDALAEHSNLGLAYQAANRFDDAIAVFRRVRAISEKALGRDHPDTLTASAHLAYAFKSANRLKEAVPFYRAALAGREAVLGRDHPDTLTALANLAGCYLAARRMKDAVVHYERLVTDRERVQGPDHKETLTARASLASGYHSAGRMADALPLYDRVAAEYERVLGPVHPDTLTVRANRAHAYYMARRQSTAVAEFRRTLADSERALGADHPLTVAIRDNLDAVTK